MKLKKVEIKGFKSFALKTEIQIKDGITAIVGPNGSGKSNISDAIRWVLGEQSIKNLRGQKMEDVIFAGTSSRKALGYCEVTITFDNRDGSIPLEYDEVAVTRRMFRSGESQYYLNKSSCRLKDIRELFMDTGVGKDGYSIIGQGRIEEILSNKPEDRRSIFEEAAGIVKYKSKKNQAEKKLEKTQANIIRIKDLIHELSKQAEVLEVQANKAKEFKKLYTELEELEVNLLVVDIKKNQDQEKNINQEKNEIERELEHLLSQGRAIEQGFNILKKEIKNIEEDIELSRNSNLNLINKAEQGKNELAIINEKKSFHEKDLIRLEEESKRTLDKINEIELTNNELEVEKQNEKDKYAGKIESYKASKMIFMDELDYLNEKEEEIEERKNNLVNIYNESSNIKSKLNSIISFDESIKKRIQRLEKDIRELILQKKENEHLHEEEIHKKNSLIAKLKALKERLEEIKINFNRASNGSNYLNQDINKKGLEKQSKLSSLKLLKSMEEDYEGYYKGVKSILIESKSNKLLKSGLVGVVAEMVKADKRYEKAIEISLGSSGQNLVTKDENSSKNIIEYLNKNRLGRVTCLPANIIRSRSLKLNEDDKRDFKILGLGHDLVEYDEKYRNVFEYLLGRTIIIENIDLAIAFAKKTKHSYRIVTLAGEILNPGGSMTGGSHGGSGVNIINRKNRIEELEIDIAEIDIELKIIKEKQEKNTKDIENKKIKMTEIEEEIKQCEYNIYSIDNSIENYKEEKNRIESLIDKSNGEILELKREEEEYSIQYKELDELLAEMEKQTTAEKSDIKMLIEAFNNEKEKKEDKSKHINDLKLDINLIENKIKNLGEKQANAELTKKELIQELEEKKVAIKSNQEEIENIKTLKESLNLSIDNLKFKQREVEEKLSNTLEIKNKSMDKFYLEQEKLTDLNKKISSQEKKLNSLEVKLARIYIELQNYESRLLEEYELTFEEALKTAKEIDNKKESILRIRQLKASIKELGHVNLSSIEEYKILSERLEFILNQQEDLMEAKQNLNNIILDMEGKMKKQFLISFKQINENFIEVFKILFNGGKAELVLDNEEDILNSGIQINAQPPGKKLQNLTLLSGGEKSLTAVALLFSILTLKPAPFCILDEIDAALDEANISKYTSYLKNFSYDTQFVLITHRKTTMEIADNLYGVTMEEDGISKLISVKLKDYVEEIAS